MDSMDNKELRTFEELSPAEVNDLVATGIMGWPPYEERLAQFNKFDTEENHNMLVGALSGGGKTTITIIGMQSLLDKVRFDPYASLDYCRLTEQRLGDIGDGGKPHQPWARYVAALQTITGADSHYDAFGLSEYGKLLLIGARAQHRCHAMLIACNLVKGE
jgi:hypothetical protein